ncbi:MAG: SelL-related redox protein [Phycisphaerales bacterium]
MNAGTSIESRMAQAMTDAGPSLAAFAASGPTLILFVRHQGCTFCREALADLAAWRKSSGEGTRAAVVQMGSIEQGRSLLDAHGLTDVAVVSDPDRELYRGFELGRGSLRQLFGPRVWWRGFLATLRGHFVGRLVGDGFQMPGAFLVEDGRIVRAFRHRDAADRPNLGELCELGPLRPAATPSASGREQRSVATAATPAVRTPAMAADGAS